jgi:flavin-binding protein dodecin
MTEHIYKIIKLTGTSTTSSDEAIRNAVQRAGKTLHNLRWFKVVENRGYIEDNDVAYFQVTVEIGFTLDEEDDDDDD